MIESPTKDEKLINKLRFAKAEQKGRDKAISILNKLQMTEAEDVYSAWDFSGHSLTNYFLEVKNREIASSDYFTTILEVEKLKAITKIAKNNDGKAYYLTIYNDGKAYLFDLSKISIIDAEVELKEMNIHTSTGTIYKKDKLVFLLPLALATKTYNY